MVNARYDNSTQDLDQGVPKLRDDLVFVSQMHGGRCFVHIEASGQGKFYRIGFNEYVLISLFDGQSCFAKALAMSARKLGKDALSHEQAVRVVRWVIDNKLGTFVDGGSEGKSSFECDAEAGKASRFKISPLTTRVRFGCPNRLIESLLPFTSWLFGRAMTILTLILIFVAGCLILFNWHEFADASQRILLPNNWLLMAGVWLTLKLVHEAGHAISCRRLGGTVGDTGIFFVLFAPMAFVDVTSSWRFACKWKRIQVALAGIQIEMLTAALATFAWCFADSTATAQILINVIVMASFSTILFNLNPLMRFDGYFVLADLIERPNLYEEPNRLVRENLSRFFFGRAQLNTVASESRRLFTLFYGYACAVWKACVWVTLLIAAATLFHGAGIVLAVIGLIAWLVQPLTRLNNHFQNEGLDGCGRQIRAVTLAVALFVIAGGVLILAPSSLKRTAPGIVEYGELAVLRADTPGFVIDVLVEENSNVEIGDPLMRLHNPGLESELRELKLAVAQSRQRHRIALNTRETAVAQVESRNLESHLQQLSELQRRADSLTIVATRNGRFLARGIGNRVGTYIREGEEICAIGDEGQKEIVLSISHAQVQEALGNLNEQVAIRVGSRPRCVGRLVRVEPHASTQVTHRALLSTEGGPLVGMPDDAGNAENDEGIRLEEPRFKAIVQLSQPSSFDIHCGERGFVSFGTMKRSLGSEFYRVTSHWLQRQVRQYQSLN